MAAVCAADDADGSGVSGSKADHAAGDGAQDQGHQERGEDAQLSGSAQHQGHGVGQQRTEVGHSANSHKDDRRIDGILDALIEHPHKAHRTAVRYRVIDRLRQTGR